MDRRHGDATYSTVLTQDDDEGYVALELHLLRDGASRRAARVVYWDADGQFALETFGVEVPLVIVEQLIAEAAARIKTR